MNWVDGVVLKNDLVGEKFRWLKIKPESEATFQVGQYLILKISEGKQNSYSVCSLPGSEIVEVLVDVSPALVGFPSGEGSRYIDSLGVGDKVLFSFPYGRFTLKDDGTQTKIFVATGSGISSIFPMVVEASGDRANNVILFWGLRHEGNIFWDDRLEELQLSRLNFSYNFVLSSPSERWMGMKGYVTKGVADWLKGMLDGGGESSEVSFYICGSGQMIADLRDVLEGGGILKEHIYWEKYFEDVDKE